MPDAAFPYELSDHAKQVIEERGIHLEWIERALKNSARIEPDRLDPSASHALAAIPEFGDACCG